ncbi:hypothetical protein GN244_ATG01530 [Phytophthora infestans]|uniref:Uncharacterized protein n=1 Tax=Phytophthora infestans TaxID=4787 RepID=A0A833WMW9_PHYIN|nr:hypothetical protein GN244_ATG01530 [Phytophthora infestans]
MMGIRWRTGVIINFARTVCSAWWLPSGDGPAAGEISSLRSYIWTHEMQPKSMVLQGEAVQALIKEANRQGRSRSSARYRSLYIQSLCNLLCPSYLVVTAEDTDQS